MDDAELVELLGHHEARVETVERLLATLVAGFTELFAMVEVIVAQLTGTMTDDERKDYLGQFQTFRTELFKHLQHADDLERDNPDLAAAVEQLVDRDNDSPPGERL